MSSKLERSCFRLSGYASDVLDADSAQSSRVALRSQQRAQQSGQVRDRAAHEFVCAQQSHKSQPFHAQHPQHKVSFICNDCRKFALSFVVCYQFARRESDKSFASRSPSQSDAVRHLARAETEDLTVAAQYEERALHCATRPDRQCVARRQQLLQAAHTHQRRRQVS